MLRFWNLPKLRSITRTIEEDISHDYRASPRVATAARSPATADASTVIRVEKRRAKLEYERRSLARWMARLRRAFHAVERTAG